jgi:DNA-binding CsgD family transcriptional regulator
VVSPESAALDATRLREAFEHSANPMLLTDDGRRWVAGNAAACELLGLTPQEVPWRTMDDFTPEGELGRLEEEWRAFLAGGAAEGWYHLHVPGRGTMPVEFSAIANVQPGRHLAVFLPPEDDSTGAEGATRRAEAWRPVPAPGEGRSALTAREREVVTLVASGLQGGDIAKRLFLSTETVKSHAQNAMAKLGVRTRAHAVAVALVTGQIRWEIYGSGPRPPTKRPPPSV